MFTNIHNKKKLKWNVYNKKMYKVEGKLTYMM